MVLPVRTSLQTRPWPSPPGSDNYGLEEGFWKKDPSYNLKADGRTVFGSTLEFATLFQKENECVHGGPIKTPITGSTISYDKNRLVYGNSTYTHYMELLRNDGRRFEWDYGQNVSFTIKWKPGIVNSSFRYLFSFGRGGSQQPLVTIAYTSSILRGYVDCSSGTQEVVEWSHGGAFDETADEWYTITLVVDWDADDMRLYVNGVLRATDGLDNLTGGTFGDEGTSGHESVIGNFYTGSSWQPSAEGDFDFFYIHRHAFNDQEVFALHRNPALPFKKKLNNNILHWPLGSQTGGWWLPASDLDLATARIPGEKPYRRRRINRSNPFGERCLHFFTPTMQDLFVGSETNTINIDWSNNKLLLNGHDQSDRGHTPEVIKGNVMWRHGSGAAWNMQFQTGDEISFSDDESYTVITRQHWEPSADRSVLLGSQGTPPYIQNRPGTWARFNNGTTNYDASGFSGGALDDQIVTSCFTTTGEGTTSSEITFHQFENNQTVSTTGASTGATFTHLNSQAQNDVDGLEFIAIFRGKMSVEQMRAFCEDPYGMFRQRNGAGGVFFGEAAPAAPQADLQSGTFNLTGSTISAVENMLADLQSGSYTVTGSTISALERMLADLQSGSYNITGSTISALENMLADLQTGSFTITGSTISALENMLADLQAGSFTLTGSNLGAFYNRLANLQTGSFTITGSTISASTEGRADLQTGAYNITGSNIEALENMLASVQAGSFNITGSTISGLQSHLADLQSGSFTLTGSNLGAFYDRLADLQSGAFAITGSNLVAMEGNDLTANLLTGSYVVTGAQIEALENQLAELQSGSFALSGSNLQATVRFVADLQSGTYALVGSNLSAFKDTLAQLQSGSFAITGSTLVAVEGALYDGGTTFICVMSEVTDVVNIQEQNFSFTLQEIEDVTIQ